MTSCFFETDACFQGPSVAHLSGGGKRRVVGIGVRLPFASWENYCVWKFLALRQLSSAWLGLGVALANMLPSTAQRGMRSESAEVPLNAGAKPNAQA